METFQFELTYADYDIAPEHRDVFCDELREQLLDHQPKVRWQQITDLGRGRFFAALRVPGDKRQAAEILANAMTKARRRPRAAAR